ncbi:PilN domain-containing protein [Kamptonema formosum]|uniref:PilN domain-containing protein n=1 Tax=Kamptonema formosum TaxID=331992 RepID=UPI00034617DF|nr:PilN domain-containing protein [Oscillatoria sp. PCC 10802]
MYSVEINFLNDRPDYKPQVKVIPKKGGGVKVADPIPLFAGVAVGVFLPAVVGGWWFVTQSKNQELQEQLARLDGELKGWTTKDQEIKAIQAEADQIKAQTQGLATLFNTSIKPISAIFQDIRERVPSGVQVSMLQQTVTADEEFSKTAAAAPKAAAPPTPAPSPTPAATPAGGAPAGGAPAGSAPPPAAPPPGPPPAEVNWQFFKQKIQLSGTAKSFDEVNDFMLTLKQSPFLNASEVKLVEANLVDNSLKVAVPDPKEKTQAAPAQPPKLELPTVVNYKIEVGVNKTLASQLVGELTRTGAIGLASRVETLQNKGVDLP